MILRMCLLITFDSLTVIYTTTTLEPHALHAGGILFGLLGPQFVYLLNFSVVFSLKIYSIFSLPCLFSYF